MDICEFTSYLYLFSPNLQYYLDFDKSDDCFQIKKTLTQEVYREVPKGMMSVSEYQLLARKFMWIDNNKIRIINNESIEKVIDVHNNMQELSYGTVPMLSLSDYITKNY